MTMEAHCFQNVQWIKFILPIFATFLGAWLAFFLQNRRDAKKQEKTNYGVLLKTQALFYEYFEAIYSVKKDFLDQHAKDAERSTRVKHISLCQKFSELDFEGISFILTTKNPDLFGDIVCTYRKCVSAIEAINERNKQYGKYSGGIAKSIDLGSGKSQVDLIFLRDFTDIMYRETDQVLQRIKQIDGELQQFIKEKFKGKHALKVTFVETATQCAKGNADGGGHETVA
ncbi:MAG TPA: hypothetical protein P5561_01165 [Candidatus Omnitrophota bacterium]|nr:hypothetical protein [Candidatus Omnitrophota bacterium]